jgi:hypothetical protein
MGLVGGGPFEKREAGAGPVTDARLALVRAGWRASGGWQRQALTAMLACAAGRTDAAPRRCSKGPLGSCWGAAGEERRRGGEVECEHRARLRPLSISLTHAHAEGSCLHIEGCTCMYTTLAVSQDGASAPRRERHSGYAPGSVRLWPTARHVPQ